MTSQSSRARQHIEERLEWMMEKSKDPELNPKWARTLKLMQIIVNTEKILEAWTDDEPYCPSRTAGHVSR